MTRMMAVNSTALALTLALAASASANVEVREDLRPGHVVRDSGVGVVVPQPGEFVMMHATLRDGAQSVGVATRRDGTVVVSHAGSEAKPEFAPGMPGGSRDSTGDEMRINEPPQAPSECDDGAYRRRAWPWADGKFAKWKSTFRWWFRASATPSYMSVTNTRDAIHRAVFNVVGAHNNCGMPDTVDATQDFQGATNDTPNISVDGHTCGTSDGVNVVSFGNMALDVRSVTCNWGYDDGGTFARITSSDTRLHTLYDEFYSWPWYAVRPDGCGVHYSVESQMTHEFGHVFGLADVGPEEEHGWLTMSPELNGPCQSSETSLGRGDIWGLQSLY